MWKLITVLIFVQIIKAQYRNNYHALASENFQSYSSDEDYTYRKPEPTNFKRNRNLESGEYDENEDLNNGVETKSVGSMIDETHKIMSEIKMKLNEEFQRLTNLDQQNQEKAKKTMAETREEIDNRVGYVEQLLYKKRDGAAGTNAMHCVKDSFVRLGRITPELLKDEERCISSELDMSRTVGKVTLDMLRDNLHKVKLQQERLNKCTSMTKRRKFCLVNMFNDLSRFKKNLKATVSAKMTETVNFVTGLANRMRTCSMAQVGKVVTRAGDVIVKFNACVKEMNEKKKGEMLLFVV